MRIFVISSGSSGNSTFLEIGGKRFLIDVGISKKRIEEFFLNNDITFNIDSIFITHEHVDHISGLKNLLPVLDSNIYMTKGTYDASFKKGINYNSNKLNIIKINDIIKIDNVSIKVIPTLHDALEPCGYIFEYNEKKLVYITDTGFIPIEIMPEISNASVYIMETNHDPEMLLNCTTRPYHLKMRIIGDHGHLSNSDAMYALAHIIGDKTKYVFFAHISEQCNSYEKIEEQKNKVFSELGMDISDIEFIYTSTKQTDGIEI